MRLTSTSTTIGVRAHASSIMWIAVITVDHSNVRSVRLVGCTQQIAIEPFSDSLGWALPVEHCGNGTVAVAQCPIATTLLNTVQPKTYSI